MNTRMKRLAATTCGLLTLAVVAAEPVPLFSGSDSYVNLGTPAALQIPSNEPFTVEGWMLFNALGTVDMLYCKNNGRSSPHTYLLGFYNGKMTAYNTAWRGNFAVSRQVDRWYHVAFAFDGANMAFYLDGALLGAAPFSFNNNVAHTAKIGGYATGADINGSISDVRVWDHARTQAEIQSAMRNRLIGTDVGLRGYWPLNEGTGNTAFDGTTAASDGTLIGTAWTNHAALAEQITGEANFAYARAFTVADAETGSSKFTNSNEVEVVNFPIPAGCDRYQINQSASPHGIDAEAWAATNDLPDRLTFNLPAADSNIVFYAWFTNMANTVTVFRAARQIRHTMTRPVPVARLTHFRTLMPAQSVVLHYAEIDTGSSGGETGGQSIPLHAMSLNLVSGPGTDATPDDPFVTVSALGTYEVELVVMNAAGNVATSAVCTVQVTAYGGETFAWTGAGGNDWHNLLNWSLHAVPIAGCEVTIGQGASVLLSAPTAELAAFTLSGGTLTFSNWNTRLSAETVTLSGGTVTLPPPFTSSQMSNRVWFVCSDFTLGTNSSINTDGKGYNTGPNQASDGYGPGAGGGTTSGGGGAGHGGVGGGQITLASTCGGAYGSADEPRYPGSGGGWGNQNGGPGGGAVRIYATGAVIVNGAINANGDKAPWTNGGGGSGGSIWITCRTLSGDGVLSAQGGLSGSGGGNGNGGGGRIAVHYAAAAQAVAGVPGVAISTLPGMRATGRAADVGSVWLTDTQFLAHNTQPRISGWLTIPGFSSWALDRLTVSNVWLRLSNDGFNLTISNDLRIVGAEGRLEIGGGAVWWQAHETGGRDRNFVNFSDTDTLITLVCGGDLALDNGGVLAVYSAATNGLASPYGARVDVAGAFIIGTNATAVASSHPKNCGSVFWRVGSLILPHETSRFSADVQGGVGGYASTAVRGFGPGGGGVQCGGSYGGKAGDYNSGAAATYGDTNRPAYPGSGGGWGGIYSYGNDGTAGGGLIWVEAEDRITVNGTMTANGGDVHTWAYHPGGGSGGAILLACKRFAGALSGKLLANGGSADSSSHAKGTGGGGGRIAVWHGAPYEHGMAASRMVVGEAPFATFPGTISVSGGIGGAGAVSRSGEAGTVRFIEVLPRGGTVMLLQ